MKAGAAGGHSTSMACAGHCAAWLFSLAALIVAAVPEYARWSLFLFALALLHWAWLVYGGHRRRGQANHRHPEQRASAHCRPSPGDREVKLAPRPGAGPVRTK